MFLTLRQRGWVCGKGSQFAVADVEVVTATVDLDEVVSYRGAVSSLQEQASSAPRVPTIAVDFNLCCSEEAGVVPNGSIEPRYHVPEEEIALGQLLPLSPLCSRAATIGTGQHAYCFV